MPKDIRSFFSVISSKKGNDSNKTPIKEKTPRKRQRTSDVIVDDIIIDTPDSAKKQKRSNSNSKEKQAKRKRIITVSSDSESEEEKKPTKTPKKEPVKLQVEVLKKIPVNNKKESPKKYISALEAFGNKPVQQDKVSVKKQLELNIHNDDDFDKTLQEIDEAELLGIKVESTVNKKSSDNESKPKKLTLKQKLEQAKDKDENITETNFKKEIPENSQSKPENSEDISLIETDKSKEDKKQNDFKKEVASENHIKENLKTKSKSSEDKNEKHSIVNNEKAEPSKKAESVTKPKPPEIKKEKTDSISNDVKGKTIISKQESLAWVDKHKPTNVNQIIGQQGEKSNVKKLTKWLKNWHHNRTRKNIPRPSPWAKDDDGAYFRAALLSGPPGVGKTTTATLVCKELGFDTVEFNASDTRNKRMVHDEVAQILKSTSLAGFYQNGAAPTKNHALLMDEVDGMSGNEDRGGIQEIINLIKTSNVPIICMCNDRQHPKIRTLANYCFDLRFSKPRLEQIRGAMMSVCFKEGVKIKPDVLAHIIQGTGQDIRQTLNQLSVWATNPENDADKVSKQSKETQKDIKLGPWDVVRKVFSAEEHKTMTFAEKSKLFFYDYSIAPLFVQENYLKMIPYCAKNETLERFAKTADSISMGDIVDKKIRSTQNWSLLDLEGMYASVIPGHYLEGRLAGQIDFPSWLGKNSKTNKFTRILSEISAHTRMSISGDRVALGLDYIRSLRDAIALPMVKNGTDGIPEAMEVLKSYNLLREDVMNIVELAQWPQTTDPFSKIDSKVKAAFTRAYNKEAPALPYAAPGAGAVKSKRGASTVDEEYAEFAEEDAIEHESNDEDDDDVNNDGMIKAKKPSTSAASKASTSGKGKASSDTKPKTSKPRGGGSKRGKK